MAGPALILDSESENATGGIGARLAPRLCAGDVVGISGPLGAGKSVLVRGILRRLMDDPDLAVPSPSFTLVQTYERADGLLAWHVDLYRLAAAEELVELGLEEAFEHAITLIEWPERAGAMLPDERLSIRIERRGEGSRQLCFEGSRNWAERLAGLAGVQP